MKVMTSNIIRVFPRKTALTPDDDLSFIGDPPMIRPPNMPVYVSCTFTWDIPAAERLADAWRQYYPYVRLGGPAFGDPGNGFTPGMFVKTGVTFTSRGCNNNCDFCLVPDRENRIRELDIKPGNSIQDNNLLQCNKSHILKVFEMLRLQSGVQFTGGLQASLITEWFVNELRSCRINQIFVACDTDRQIKPLERAAKLLKDLPRDKKRCYVLIGRDNESMGQALDRLETVWDLGFMPFAQLYQPPLKRWKTYTHAWRQIQRNWSRPAIMKACLPVAL